MEQSDRNRLNQLDQCLEIYKLEIIGRVFVDKLRFPLPIIWTFFAFVNFGVLLFLHGIEGHPTPSNIRELFGNPSTHYYYPNLISIIFDLISAPLFIVFLTFFRSFIPKQFVKLKQDGLISEKPVTSTFDRLRRFATHNRRFQIVAIIIFPVLDSLIFSIIGFIIWQPQDLAWAYAVLIGSLGIYSKITIIVQVIYIFLIMNNYKLNIKLNLVHPDQCSGMAPFGNLAISSYIFLLFWAIFQAIVISGGGGPLGQIIADIPGSTSLFFLWFLFPLAFLFIFDQLVYKPHIVICDLQTEHLETFNTNWTKYHQEILSDLTDVIGLQENSQENKTNHSFNDELALLENWAKLQKYVSDLHTWPISKSSFRLIALVGNPFIPLLIPIILEFVGTLII